MPSKEVITSFRSEPARSYTLNCVERIISYFRNRVVSTEQETRYFSALDEALDNLEDLTKPFIPHTETALIDQTLAFTEKIKIALLDPAVSVRIPELNLTRTQKALTAIEDYCVGLVRKRAPKELLVNTQEIGALFGFPDMHTEGWQKGIEELNRWSTIIEHPSIPVALNEPVSLEELNSLMRYTRAKLLRSESENGVMTLTSTPEKYKLFWSLVDHYIVCEVADTYTLANVFSEIIPHNVAHFIHLDALDRANKDYLDDMVTRAFFEAVAVLSEYIIVDEMSNSNSEHRFGMFKQLNEGKQARLTPDELADFIIADRIFEFRLRAVRLLTDVLAMDKSTAITDIVETVKAASNLPHDNVYRECLMYYAFTGLGGCYTLGYRKLLENGKHTVGDAISDPSGQPILTWEQFNALTGKKKS